MPDVLEETLRTLHLRRHSGDIHVHLTEWRWKPDAMYGFSGRLFARRVDQVESIFEIHRVIAHLEWRDIFFI